MQADPQTDDVFAQMDLIPQDEVGLIMHSYPCVVLSILFGSVGLLLMAADLVFCTAESGHKRDERSSTSIEAKQRPELLQNVDGE